MQTQIVLPEKLVSRLRELGVDIEAHVIDVIIREVRLDPDEETRVRLELAERFFDEGVRLIDKDPVQASEKLYKAAEECIKALALHLKLEDVLVMVRERGRWTITELEKAAREAAKKINEEIYVSWDRASYLHVWGFHEAKLDREAIKERIPYIEKMIKISKEALKT